MLPSAHKYKSGIYCLIVGNDDYSQVAAVKYFTNRLDHLFLINRDGDLLELLSQLK